MPSCSGSAIPTRSDIVCVVPGGSSPSTLSSGASCPEFAAPGAGFRPGAFFRRLKRADQIWASSAALGSRKYIDEIPIRIMQQERAIAPWHQRRRHYNGCPARIHPVGHRIDVLHFELQDGRLICRRSRCTDIEKLDQVLGRSRNHLTNLCLFRIFWYVPSLTTSSKVAFHFSAVSSEIPGEPAK